jgi:hypothetical protein
VIFLILNVRYIQFHWCTPAFAAQQNNWWIAQILLQIFTWSDLTASSRFKHARTPLWPLCSIYTKLALRQTYKLLGSFQPRGKPHFCPKCVHAKHTHTHTHTNTHTYIHTHAHTHLCDGAPSVQLLAAELLLASWTTAPPQPLEELFHPPPPLKLLWGCVGWSPATQDLLVCVFVCVSVCVCVCDVQDENMISYIAHTPRWFLSAGSKRSHFHRQNSGCACFSAPRK